MVWLTRACVCMWFQVCPCHLISTMVHHHHPADLHSLTERAERPQQRHGEASRPSLSCMFPLTQIKEFEYKYVTGLTHAFMPMPLTCFSPSLSSLTPCPLLIDGTSHPSSINLSLPSLKPFLLNAGVMFCMENSLVKCIAELRSLTALGEMLAWPLSID